MGWLVIAMLASSAPAGAVTADSGGVDTGVLVDTGQEITSGTSGGEVTEEEATTNDTGPQGWHGGYSAADIAAEPGGTPWSGGCQGGGSAAILLFGIGAFGRRRRLH